MASDVYFYPGTRELGKEAIESQVRELAGRVWFDSDTGGRDVLVKLHVGEIHKDRSREVATHIRPVIVKTLVDMAREMGGNPFLGDSTPVYGFGMRCEPDGHRYVAQAHGFGEDRMGVPFVVLDEYGTVSVPAPVLKRIEVPKVFYKTGKNGDPMVVASHVTGHPFAGIGAALKQPAMGGVGEATKWRIHGTYRASLGNPENCVGCGECVDACRYDYIVLREGKPEINAVECKGCGGCAEMCENDALQMKEQPGLGNDKYSRMEFQRNLMRAAKGAVDVFDGRILYISDATAMSPHCDCFEIDKPHVDICPDIGLLASRNPVALDHATLDLMREAVGGENALQRRIYEQMPDLYIPVDLNFQILFAARSGLGTSQYRLVTL